ncbi:hypothetical protein ALQ04_01644 [Pseudomonas cichorii]|uniref:Uncharacterized protein n=1 Tax=Pseudomonas cichorii TaxID=36746 RepID=A0A3M4LWZ7_PSECI|nr:hypothetical protein [Pseudomonas cichorii]RMQ45989.1 hypothetical protein ALQ04_01644 [Pseudomonas cichorii]
MVSHQNADHRSPAPAEPNCNQASEKSGTTTDLPTTESSTALLCCSTSVDAQKTNSCCEAVGINALTSATAEALIPHEKLRRAATPDAPLFAQERPPAQPVVGYKQEPKHDKTPPEEGRRYWPADLTNVRPEEWAQMSPRHVAEFAGMTEVWLLLEAAQKRIAAQDQTVANLRETAEALIIDSNVANEQLLEVLLECNHLKHQLNAIKGQALEVPNA